MFLLHQVVLSTCSGYRCNNVVGIHYEIEEYDDEFSEILEEDDNQTVYTTALTETLCDECAKTNNVDRHRTFTSETPQGVVNVHSSSKSLLTIYEAYLNDVNGIPYVKSLICSSVVDRAVTHIMSFKV